MLNFWIKLKYWIFDLESIQNPLLPGSYVQARAERACAKNGHITCGRYYGLPQSNCVRCGKKTHWAVKAAPDWDIPTDSL